jgi:hypothetical protein
MAKNSSYKLLKEHVTAVELSMEDNLEWFATRLNTAEFPVLGDNVAKAVKNPVSTLRPDQKATQMFNPLLNRVDLDPSALDKFVEILKIERVKFRPLIQKLDRSKFVILAINEL